MPAVTGERKINIQIITQNTTLQHVWHGCVVLREMVEKMPSPHTYLLLGDAYMNIQEVSLIFQQYFIDPQCGRRWEVVCVTAAPARAFESLY